MILLSHPAPNLNVRHVARALDRAGVLGEFWTNVEVAAAASNEDDSLKLPTRVATASSLPPDVSRDVACRLLDREVSARLSSEQFKGVYAYEGGAEASFREAGKRGLLRIYDLPDGHWRAEQALCDEEASLEPEWASILPASRSSPRMSQRRDSELEQADLVFVASTFMLRTLDPVASENSTVAVLRPSSSRRGGLVRQKATSPCSKKLRVLFAGDLDQRNGLSYLFHACNELKAEVYLTVIGTPPSPSCPALNRALRDVRWKPLGSTAELHTEMARHDVFVAPSIFEAFNPILVDALSAGLPLIATPHTSAPDLIDDGVEGFIIPIRSSESIVSKLDLLRRNPDIRAEMANKARQRAMRESWDRYEQSLAASVATALACR